MRLIAFLFLISLISCGRQNSKISGELNSPDFAKGFYIIYEKDFIILKVLNPWQNAENVEFTYILTGEKSVIPDSLNKFPVIKTPVRKVIALSTTHIGFISILEESESIVGISGENFVNDRIVHKSIAEKKCFDVGYFPNINFERILSLKPDVVFLYGLDATVQSTSVRLAEAGIPCVMVSEYLENHPLGKAEWIKFFAAFYNKDKSADIFFDEVKEKYIHLRDTVEILTSKPTVLAGLPWKDTWFLPGGKSFSVQFIADAGGDYLWKDDTSREFIPLDLESVFSRALNADIWINTGSVATKAELLDRDKRFGVVKAFMSDSLFNNNARLSAGGGNDYWESGVASPQIILQDLIEIFHPGFLPKHDLLYYRRLE